MHARLPIVMSAAANLGATLRRAREHLGLSREQLARTTTIPVGDLEAIEAGLIDALPRGMFRRAEIRAYAEAVGLDPAATLAAFLVAERAHAVPSPPGGGTIAVGNFPDASAVAPTTRTIAIASPVRDRHVSTRAPASLPRGFRKEPVPGRSVDRMPHVRAIRRPPLLALAGVGLSALALIQVTTPDSRRPVAAAVQEATRETVATEPVVFSPADHGQVPDVTHAPLERAAGNGRRDGEAPHHATTPGRRPVPPGAQPVGLVPPHAGIAEASRRGRPAPASPVLVIRTRPRGARVTVNGIGRGETPVTVRYLTPGVVRVRVVRDGFQSEERLVRLLESGTETVTISLRRRR